MKIVAIHQMAVPLEANIDNAMVNFSKHNVSLVAVVSDVRRNGKNLIGYGFNSIGRFAQSGILQQRIIPRLLDAKPDSLLTNRADRFCVESVYRIAMKDEKPGGHGDRAGAVAAIELAFWDLNAKITDEPAWNLIAGFADLPKDIPNVSTYAAGGYYYKEGSLKGLRDELRGYIDHGFNKFKIKIGGASLDEDLKRIDVAVTESRDANNVAVDANGCFDKKEANTYLKELAARNIRWYEEPVDPLDFESLKALASNEELPIATGENLFSGQDVQNLLRYGGMKPKRDVFQMDAGLGYGLSEYLRIISMIERYGHDRSQCFPHGGHLINLHIAAGLGLGGCEAYPGVFKPFGGFGSSCRVEDGLVKPSDAPGFGLEQNEELSPYLKNISENT